VKNQNPTKQQLLSHQALRFEHPQDLIRLSPVTMPSRQEVFEGLRTLSEEVMESLRILFFMIFALTKAINPGENVPDHEVNPIHQLVQEVRVQRQKISELGQIITNKMMDPHSRSSGPQSPDTTVGSEVWELMEEEELQHSAMGLNKSGSVVPGTSQVPMMIPQTMPMPSPVVPKTPTKTAGIPLAGRQPQSSAAASMPGVNANSQVALTQQALDNWGQKKITWGKKHPGKTFVQVYEEDANYVKWVLARIGSLGEEIEDFANYAVTRQRLEVAAMNAPP
jgi:hypothetical protein